MYFHHADPSSYKLATDKLNGENFGQGKRSAEISFIAKIKLGFVTGTIAKPGH